MNTVSEQEYVIPISKLIAGMLLKKEEITSMELITTINQLIRNNHNVYVTEPDNDFVNIERFVDFDGETIRLKKNLEYNTIVVADKGRSTLKTWLSNYSTENILNMLSCIDQNVTSIKRIK